MHLYNMTLEKATGITHAVQGCFSGLDSQEILISRGKSIELLKLDAYTGMLHSILSIDVFGIVRSLATFRHDTTKDLIVIGSDSGKIVILEYDSHRNIFRKVHEETFGKSGCRRLVPGQYLAVDPKGRSIFTGAVESQKLIFPLARTGEGNLVCLPAVEAHSGSNLLYDMVGVDTSSDNPTFACLEIDYQKADSDPGGPAASQTEQVLTFYEHNVKAKDVKRTVCGLMRQHANMLIAVPGGRCGPSGVLVCTENYLVYRNIGEQHDVICPIPRRRNDLDNPERGMIIICCAVHKASSMFFFLVQTEQGDLFRVVLPTTNGKVTAIKMKYFDTVPVAAAMCILRSGFLFVASEFGNHCLYQTAQLGDDDDEPQFSSAMPLEQGDTFFFAPRPLRNLVLVDEMDSLSPIIDCHIADLANEGTPQLYIACGRGPRSTLRVLQHGLEVSALDVSDLPATPNGVWTIKKSGMFDCYIIVSFSSGTMVLSIGNTVEKVVDSGLLGYTSSLACSIVGDDAVLQVYPEGFHMVRVDKSLQDWKTLAKKQVVRCAANRHQLLLALAGATLVYFKLDLVQGTLKEYNQRREMGYEVVSLGLCPGDFSHCAVVGLANSSISILSLDRAHCLSVQSTQSLTAWPEALCIVEMGGGASATLYLNIGLHNGVLLRMVLDPLTGDLHDSRTRYLGTRPVKLFTVSMQGRPAVLAVSSRSWLSYFYQNKFYLTPLLYNCLEFAARFCSDQCPEGIIAISSNCLRMLTVDKPGQLFTQVSFPLEYTPKKFVVHPETGKLIIIETEHNACTEETKNQHRLQMAKEMEEAADEDERETAKDLAQDLLNDILPDEVFGSAKAGVGMWASQIRVLDPATGETLFISKLDQNEAATCIGLVKFTSESEDESFIVVGVAKDYLLNPRQFSSAYLSTYRILDNCCNLELVHRTLIDELPGAICAFQGKVLVGVGKLLRLYDMGKKKLLRKCENKHIPNMVVQIREMGKRVYVSDIQESVFFIKYKETENQLVIFADDTQPRWITTTCILDYNTIATADKFGTVFVMRLGSSVSDDVDEDPAGNKTLWDRGLLNGASQKADFVASFYVGEIVTSLQKGTLTAGGTESLVYTTLSGSLGVLVPFTSHEDQDFFQHLEMHMRTESPPLSGRDHLSFRSYYYPLKNAIDGDLCEQFSLLDSAKQSSIAERLSKTPNEVMKKIEDIRIRYAF